MIAILGLVLTLGAAAVALDVLRDRRAIRDSSPPAAPPGRIIYRDMNGWIIERVAGGGDVTIASEIDVCGRPVTRA